MLIYSYTGSKETQHSLSNSKYSYILTDPLLTLFLLEEVINGTHADLPISSAQCFILPIKY